MQSDPTKATAELARRIQASIDEVLLPPPEVVRPGQEPILPYVIVANTKGYIEKIAHQVNAAYTKTCYDACAVMIRRLVEVLIIEVFENYKLSAKILNQDGHYFFLNNLITAALNESAWTLGRTTRRAFQKKMFKTLGDRSAHSRRYNAKRIYIDDVSDELRMITEDLLYLAGLK